MADNPKPAPSGDITLAVDTVTRRPGCVLLQAAYGFAANNEFLTMTFDPEDWVLAPTPNMAAVTGTPAQWQAQARLLKLQRTPREILPAPPSPHPPV